MKYLALLLLCTSFSIAADQSAEDILEKAAKAIGAEMVSKNPVKSIVLKGKMSAPMLGGDAQMEIYSAEGGKVLQRMVIPAQGMNVEVTQGCDGKDCYMENTLQGVRKLEGEEKEKLLLDSDFTKDTNWRDAYSSWEYLGEGMVEGRKVHKLKLVSKGGIETVSYYDTETYLTLKSDVTVESEMGRILAEILYSDYKTLENGLKIAMKNNISSMGAQMELNIETVEINVPIPDEKFKLPESLKTN